MVAPPWLTLITGEAYQPARLYYQLQGEEGSGLASAEALTNCWRSLDCMIPGDGEEQWLWQFEAEAKALRFERLHHQLRGTEHPVTLGQLAMVTTEAGTSVRLTVFSLDRLLLEFRQIYSLIAAERRPAQSERV